MMINKEILERIQESGMIYIMLTSMISSDNNITEEEIQNNLKLIKEFQTVLPETKFSEEKKKEYFDYLEKGVSILKKDLGKMQKEKTITFEQRTGWHLEFANEE